MMHMKTFPIARAAFATFVIAHADALVNAASLLGGAQAAINVAEIVRDIAEPLPLTRRLARKLEGLRELLTLEHVSDLDSVEAAHFAAIDPASPAVAEICWLTDQYVEHLDALRDADPVAFQAQSLAA